MAAIKVAVAILPPSAASSRVVSIHFDGKAAILALSSLAVGSRLMKGNFMIRLVWMSGHNGIDGNCKADKPARAGT